MNDGRAPPPTRPRNDEAIALLTTIATRLLSIDSTMSEMSKLMYKAAGNGHVQMSNGEGGGMGGVRGTSSTAGLKDKRPRKKRPDGSYTKGFTAFWAVYPRREGKGRAWDIWTSGDLDKKLSEILDGVAMYKCSKSWMKDGGAFVPHPATWLNQRRWEDDPERELVKAKHAPVLCACGQYLNLPEEEERGACNRCDRAKDRSDA